MVDVLTEIDILCSPEKVAAFASVPTNAPKWYVKINSAEPINWQAGDPVALGLQTAFKARFMGRDLAYVYEIVEFVPNKKLVMRTADGPFPMETTYTWQKIDDNKTHMSLRNCGQPSGFSKLMAPMMKSMMRKAMEADLKMLKQLMESDN